MLDMVREPLADDEELRRFASSGAGDALMSVIVEVQTPPVSLLGVRSLGAVRQGLSAQAASERQRVGQENLDRVLAALEAEGPARQPTVIPGAHSVVVSVTAEQLRRLVALPGIAMIRRNHKVVEKTLHS